MSGVLVWFRRDLRTHDQPALHRARAVSASEGLPLRAVISLPDPGARLAITGLPKVGPHRLRWLEGARQDLRERLSRAGVEVREAIDVAPVLRESPPRHLFYGALPCPEEAAEEARVVRTARSVGASVHRFQTDTLVHAEDLPFDRLPLPFTSFRKAVESAWRLRAPEGEPWPGEDEGEGEGAALRRQREFIWEKDRLRTYKETRNGMLNPDDSTRLSPFLSWGCLSPRTLAAEVRAFEAEHGANKSTYWLVFELLWRDFFHRLAWESGARLFHRRGVRDAAPNDRGIGPGPEFDAWRQGRTAEPIVDACMNELRETGWLSNRGRQIAASYLIHDLGVDWRCGAEWFEHLLIDDDPASNWGNWQAIAGVGTDPRPVRRFDPRRQAEQYDPDGAYVRRWATATNASSDLR